MARRRLPVVRVVSGVDSHHSFRSRLRSAIRTARPPVRAAIEVAIGIWPIWVMTAFAMGLIWAAVLGGSP
jgi:hypothetical protein